MSVWRKAFRKMNSWR